MKKTILIIVLTIAALSQSCKKGSKPVVTDNTDIDTGTIITVTAAQIAHRFTPGIYS